jgi:hypothetical protein
VKQCSVVRVLGGTVVAAAAASAVWRCMRGGQ